MAVLHTECPWCGVPVQLHDGRTPERTPRPGDVSLCVYCLGIAIYIPSGSGLTVRRASFGEMEIALRIPDVRDAYALLQQRAGRTVDEAIEEWRKR